MSCAGIHGRTVWEVTGAPEEAARAAREGRLPVRFAAEAPRKGGAFAWTVDRVEQGVLVAAGAPCAAGEPDETPTREERLRTLIAAMPDPVFFKDGAGRWLEVNDAALELFGLVGVDYRGKTDAELAMRGGFYREAFLACVESDEAAWEAGVTSKNEEAVPSPDGRLREYEVYKVPLFHADGRRKALVVLGREITERKHAERAVQENERRLRLIIDTVPIAMALVDRAGRVVYVNHTATELLGASRESMLGVSAADPRWGVTAPDGAPIPPEQLPYRQVLRTEAPLYGYPMALRRGDNDQRIVVSISAVPAPDLDAVILAIVDMTERARLERMKSEFIQIASHELRTPLTSLLAWVQLSQSRVTAGEPIELSTLERMERSVRRLAALVDQLLLASQHSEQPVPLEPAVLDMRSLIEDVVRDVQRGAVGRDIHMDLPADVAFVRADRGRIEQVVWNLLDNALKYSPTEQPVSISVRVVDAAVETSVTDRGGGILPDQQRMLFERFSRMSSDATIRSPGLGLGLFISRENVLLHGGQMGIDTRPGEGSTFWFTLPRQPTTAGREIPDRADV